MPDEITVLDLVKELKEDFKRIENKLFIDNGNKCLQSRVNDNSRFVKILSVITTGTAISVLTWFLTTLLSKP